MSYKSDFKVFIDGTHCKIGDVVYHKYRGKGRISPAEIFSTDPTSVIVDFEDNDETLEVSIGLLTCKK